MDLLGHLSAVTLLLGSLAWTLVAGQGQDPFEVATPRHFRHLFIGRCAEYQQVLFPGVIEPARNCTDLWLKFHASWAHKDPCNNDIDIYDEFFAATTYDANALNRPLLYWSGDVVPLAYEFSAEARRYANIRYILPGYMVRNVFTWCGKNSTEDDGMNFDDCPEWGSCPDGTFIPPEAFWKALSEHLALSVTGEIRLLLNGSSGLAYKADRTFGKYELANLDSTRNPVLHVSVVHDVDPRPNAVTETCYNGSLVDLKRDVEAKGMIFKCEDDPEDLLMLQCVDHADSALCEFDSAVYGQPHLSLSAALASAFVAFLVVQK